MLFKNRTFLGVLSIVLAVVICFGIAPLVTKTMEAKIKVVMFTSPMFAGEQITSDRVATVEVSGYNIPSSVLKNADSVVGKYAKSQIYQGSFVFPEMLSDTMETSDTRLRNLGENEMAMSITIKNLASGLSGKLEVGDIIRIISIDDNKEAVIYEELEYVEVLATTTDEGVDNQGASENTPDGNNPLPATVTVVLQDNLQALRLIECENKTLHAALVSRGDKDVYLDLQKQILEEIKSRETAEDTEEKNGPAFIDQFTDILNTEDEEAQ